MDQTPSSHAEDKQPLPVRLWKSQYLPFYIIGAIIIFCGLFLGACCVGPSILIALAPNTPTPIPTSTKTPTQTPTITLTPSITSSPTITLTPSITPTPTITLTPSLTSSPTITPSPTYTPIPTATEDIRAQFVSIDVRDLVINPSGFEDEPIKLRGEVFVINVSGGTTEIQMWVAFPGSSAFDREPVYVLYLDTLTGVYEGTYIDVYGYGAGTVSGTNAFGGLVVQPAILAIIIESL